MFSPCDWSLARPRLGRLVHNSSSHPIIRSPHLHMLVASQRGECGSTWKTGRTENESGRWSVHPFFFTSSCELDYRNSSGAYVSYWCQLLLFSSVLFADCFLSSSKIDFCVLCLNNVNSKKCVAYLFKGQSEMNGKVKGKRVALYLAAPHYKPKPLYCEVQSSRTHLSESHSILKSHRLFIVTAEAPTDLL